jgi:hypothetical protein
MTRKYNIVKKDRLYYNQFKYSIGFDLSEASCLRFLDHGMIDDVIQRRKQWREIAQQRRGSAPLAQLNILKRGWQDITEKTSEDLHTVADVLMQTQLKFKLVVGANQCYVYTNDVALIDILDDLDFLTYKTYTQAVIARDKNTIQLRNPKHQFRSYFRSIRISAQQKDHLVNFFHNQQNQVRISQALTRWFDQPFEYLQDYFFVDHDSQTWLTMLSLVSPGLIRKTMHIIPAK